MASIRAMRYEDLDAIYDLEVQLFGQSAWPKETLEKDMELFEFDVLLENEEIVGYCSLAIMLDYADVLNIGISKEHQRKGYGRLLMQHMIQKSWMANVPNITLEVRVSNHPAMALYESLGFKKVTKRKQYYQDGEDAFLMILERGQSNVDLCN